MLSLLHFLSFPPNNFQAIWIKFPQKWKHSHQYILIPVNLILFILMKIIFFCLLISPLLKQFLYIMILLTMTLITYLCLRIRWLNRWILIIRTFTPFLLLTILHRLLLRSEVILTALILQRESDIPTALLLLQSHRIVIQLHQIRQTLNNNLPIMINLNNLPITWAHGLSWSHRTFKQGRLTRYRISLISTTLFFRRYNSYIKGSILEVSGNY
jgi:hypothetical protein